MQITSTPIPGCLVLHPAVHRDARGWLVKSFHRPEFARLGLPTDFAEGFHTVSGAGVLRGLHLQLPPHDHVKLVGCPAGAVLDVVVDLRRDSPGYGRHHLIPLRADEGIQVLVPAGLAHGFLVVEGPAVVTYRTTTVHAPEADAGIHWASAGIDWPLSMPPVTSARDEALPRLADFDSPFRYRPDGPVGGRPEGPGRSGDDRPGSGPPDGPRGTALDGTPAPGRERARPGVRA